MAKSECYLLLSNPPSASEVSENQLQIAQLWIESLGGRLDSAFNKKWTPETILARWNTWQKLNPLQREQALALELLRISPRAAAAQPVISLNAKEQLAALSTSNSERMLKQLAAAFPASKDAQNNVALTKLANQMASKLKFNYGRPVNPLQFTTSPEGYNAPAASPRELAALDLESLDGLYSHMIDKSPSVEFLTLVGRSSRGENPQIGTLLRRETILLKGKFANENGFALPRFATVGELLDFFEFWDPAAAEEVFRANWNSLPASMRTYPEFRAYVELHPEEIFPLDKAFTQLGPLRSRLNQYVMTTEDSEEFLKQAFRQYVLSLGSEDSKAAERLKVEVENSGAVMQLFRNKIFAFLHMPAGMALRIPVAVTAADYTLSRVEDRPSPFSRQSSTNSGPFRNGPYSPYSKPSSMDHNTKP